MDNVPRTFPHNCGTRTTWITEGNNTKQYKVVCSFCRKLLGYWNWTSVNDDKVYPRNANSKFSTTQKKSMK